MKPLITLIFLIVGILNVSAQTVDTIDINDINKTKKIEPFSHRNLMYKIIDGKASLNALVELNAFYKNEYLVFTKSTKLGALEMIDSVLVEPTTMETKYITLKNGRRDSLQLFDFGTKNKVLLGKSFDPTFFKETKLEENTFCSLVITELFKKITIKEKTTYVIKNYNPYSNRVDYQKLTVVGKETLDVIGGKKLEAWKLELIQGKFIYRVWLDVENHELIKQVSIFPNGVEYWESRVY